LAYPEIETAALPTPIRNLLREVLNKPPQI